MCGPRSWCWRDRGGGHHATKSRGARRSGSCRTASSRRCIAVRRRWCSRPPTRGSACPCSRPCNSVRPSSAHERRRCLKWPATRPRGWSHPTTSTSPARLPTSSPIPISARACEPRASLRHRDLPGTKPPDRLLPPSRTPWHYAAGAPANASRGRLRAVELFDGGDRRRPLLLEPCGHLLRRLQHTQHVLACQLTKILISPAAPRQLRKEHREFRNVLEADDRGGDAIEI